MIEERLANIMVENEISNYSSFIISILGLQDARENSSYHAFEFVSSEEECLLYLGCLSPVDD